MEGPANRIPAGWEKVRFDEILDRIERKVELNDSGEYARVGVRWYGNGAFVRDRVVGADVARKQQWIVRAGDVVYNKLFAWKGSFAIADKAVDGHIVSDKFPTYTLDTERVEPRYLGHYFRTHQLAFQAERLSKGAAAISKLTLNPPQFWDLTVPLPPPTEQERLVAVLDAAEEKVTEAARLRVEAELETAALVTAAIGEALLEFPATGTVADVLTGKPRNGWSAPCDNAEGGTAVLALGAVTGFVYRPGEYKRTSEATEPGAHYWLEPGDLLVTRSNTARLLGHAAIYSGDPFPCIYPDLMMRLKVDSTKADTRFLYYWLRTPAIRSRIEHAGSGTSSTMQKITQQDVMGLPFPLGLPPAEQEKAAKALDAIVSRLEEVRSVQQRAAQDLSALMPALLDRVFQGELGTGSRATVG
jgi:type I restriction enzyme S subunit